MENLISVNEQKIFKEFLKTTDYEIVSKDTGYSLSTVCNILARKTNVNKRTECILDGLRNITKKNMSGISSRIKTYIDGNL